MSRTGFHYGQPVEVREGTGSGGYTWRAGVADCEEADGWLWVLFLDEPTEGRFDPFYVRPASLTPSDLD